MAINSIKDDEEQSLKGKGYVFARLFKYMTAYWGKMILTVIVLCIGVGISVVNPILIERAINVDIMGKNMKGLFVTIGIGIALNVMNVFFNKARQYMMADVINDVLMRIREELYRHIQTLGFKFFDSRPTGKILSRIMGDVNSLKSILENSVTMLLPNFITIIAVVVVMLVKSPLLALSALVSLPLLMGGLWFIQYKGRVLWTIHRKKSSNLNAFLHERIAGVKIVQVFGAEEESIAEFKDAVGEHRSSFIKACRYSDAFGPVIDICWSIGSIAMYLIAVEVIGAERVEIGTLAAFSTYISMFWQPISSLASFYNQLITNMAAAERIFEVLDTEPEIKDAEDAVDMPEIKGDVDFEDVTFGYEENSTVLRNVSFHIDAGETIALVGPTGAGKTTIVNLIARFYDVFGGKVLIDGQDIAKVHLESFRAQLGIMTQESYIFTGTIRDNIRYGKLDATDEEIEAAAKAVHAHDFIMNTEKGYDTELHECGAGLSNGQKQLLALARTMLSKPNILILDEATSSIDTKTELLVQSGIEAVLKGRTSFVVAHRLSTIQNADRIFVVDEGGIKESGSPKELLAKKGVYYSLYMAQFEEIA